NIVLRNNVARGGPGVASSPRGGLGAGGGLYAIQSVVRGTNIISSNNIAQGGDAPGAPGISNDGQLADGLGGGVSIIFGSFSLTNLQITGNTAQGANAGGKAGLGLGGAMFIEQSSGTITNGSMSNNTARGGTSSSANGSGGSGLGGGIFATDDDLTVEGVTFSQNAAFGNAATGGGATSGDGGGGALYVTRAQKDARSVFRGSNIIIAGNSATTGPGAVPAGFGGGIFCNSSELALDHTTLAANTIAGPGIRRGPAIALIGVEPTTGCAANVRNSIVADHGQEYSAVYANIYAGASTFNNNLWSGNKAPNLENEYNQPITDQNVLGGSPAFASPGAPSFDYHLTPASAAINKAQGSTLAADFDGQRRPFGASADVGADEYSTQIVASATTSGTTLMLTWRRPPVLPLTGYTVVYTKEAGASDAQQPSPIAGIAADATSFTLSGLTPGKTYTVTLVARDGGGAQLGAADGIALRAGGYQVLLPLVNR
ncbi:MAG: fibronectin type III domain-containing protein, partial [Chloroflexales bacterium]|nr:fibronectin type III domain-containing protein [Chloroflexales bacterium]